MFFCYNLLVGGEGLGFGISRTFFGTSVTPVNKVILIRIIYPEMSVLHSPHDKR